MDAAVQQKFDAVLFDLDDTLVPEMAPERESLLAACSLASMHGIEATALAQSLADAAGALWGAWGMAEHYRLIGYSRWEGLWGPYDGDDAGLDNLARWLPDYRQRAWDAALTDNGVQDPRLRDRIIDRYRLERESRLVPFPETAGVLDSVSARHRLAVVTNGSPAVQRRKLDRSGLAGWFEFISISGAVGAGKPHPLPFTAALDALGVEPARAAMVGNSSAADMAGAKNLGMFAVWVNRTGDEPKVVEPDAEIRSLGELLELL